MKKPELNKWYKSDDKEYRPGPGETILYASWYDGFHYGTGYYLEDSDSICVLDTGPDEESSDKISFDDPDFWMLFEEPGFEEWS